MNAYSETRLPLGAALWRSRGSVGAVVPADGCVDLILREGQITVSGPSTRWIATDDDGDGGSIGLRLPPGAAGGVLGVTLVDLADRAVPLEHVADRGTASELRVALLLIEEGHPPGEPLAAIVSRAIAASPPATVIRRNALLAAPASGVAAELGTSERTLRRRMLSTFGYGYATLVRIERVGRARRLLSGGASAAEAAALAGFADQPHLTREFRRLVGATPAQVAGSSA